MSNTDLFEKQELKTDLMNMRRPERSNVDIEQIRNNARNKSVGNNKKVRYVKLDKSKYKLKPSMLALSTIIIVSALLVMTPKMTQQIENNKIINQELEEYNNLVRRETFITDTSSGKYDFDTADIAYAINKDFMNLDKAIYGVYSNIGFDEASKIEQTNDVVRRLVFLSPSVDDPNIAVEDTWKSFEKYVSDGLGFKKEDGTADYEAYSDAMREKILKEHEQEKNQINEEDFGINVRR